jgi:2-polyprenyl-3-methyl-5-hydroxy-6-metoxy-1,4-benzoquinol methylase
MKGHEPFNYDVDTNGRYVYTGPEARKSAIVANSRQSEVLHSLLLEKHFESILDLGCGDGTFTSEFLKYPKIRILGMDPADRAIKFASEKFATEPRIQFTSKSAVDLIREGYFFDLVIMRGVLHHCIDPADVINQASQLSLGVVRCTATIPYSPSFADGSTNSTSAPFNPPRISVLNQSLIGDRYQRS